MTKKKCTHNDIEYYNLVQVDGNPCYVVQCNECDEYGLIHLEESTNDFGYTLKQAKQIVKENSFTSKLNK